MIKELSEGLTAKREEYEVAKNDYLRKKEELKNEKEYTKSSGGNDREMISTRNIYLGNLNQITSHYYNTILVIAKEVANIRFCSNRIIKTPDIAKNIITDVIESAKNVEV